ncbi:MAG TPA: hypothetical protein VFD53_10585 [Ilumatobacter sp.]|jgi:hypothetical protein|nr:hypothetical protein [Ilumatobacter sp.]
MADVGPGIARFAIGYSRWNKRFLGLLGLGPRFSEVVVDDANLRVRMGWAFHAEVPRADIRRVAATERPFFAWGVHGWRGRWLVNGSSDGIVGVEVDPPARAWTLGIPFRLRTVHISLADPNAFIAALTGSTRGAGSSALPS